MAADSEMPLELMSHLAADSERPLELVAHLAAEIALVKPSVRTESSVITGISIYKSIKTSQFPHSTVYRQHCSQHHPSPHITWREGAHDCVPYLAGNLKDKLQCIQVKMAINYTK